MAKRSRIVRQGTADENRRADIAAAEEDEANPANREAIRKSRSARATIHGALKTLKAAREEAGLSLSEMQKRTGIARGNLCRIENLKGSSPTLATLERYARAVGCRIELNIVQDEDPEQRG